MVSRIQLFKIRIECTISRVFLKKGSLWETPRCIDINPLNAMKLLNEPSKFMEVVTMVTFLSFILETVPRNSTAFHAAMLIL
ncbi:hypothetical protein H5410_001094 [Solanum commersonii]|uniref:Uncharacterized protein n=1 Tax=Solanum commersonii TaxID=4109 RepID=A0A9J6AN87_SOLCO|nr:hypothetical protein H5410_011043 [Solanum commersonii]KAG5629377.1 hypothetical protein H5410_001094 [Solanum commersonii]